MADLICPPPWEVRKPCPCRGLRVGVGLLAICVYSAVYAPVFFGASLAAVVAGAMRGDVPVIWSGVAVFGVLSVIGGFIQLHREGHGFKAGSFLWSAGVVALVSWRLAHWPNLAGLVDWFGSPVTPFNYHFLRMLLVAWLASNISNIALQLIEVWPRRPRVRRPARMRAMPSGLLQSWSRRVTMIEEIEGGHVPVGGRSAVHPHGRPHIAPDLLEQLGDVPLIDLVPDGAGEFVPFDLPEGERVPVKRRR